MNLEGFLNKLKPCTEKTGVRFTLIYKSDTIKYSIQDLDTDIDIVAQFIAIKQRLYPEIKYFYITDKIDTQLDNQP